MQQAVAHIRNVTAREPRVVVVLGSGLGAFADELADPIAIPYSDIPGWPVSTAVGHSGKLVFGKLGTLDVAVMAGRAHLYEGYTPAQVTMGVRVLHRLGAQSVVFTNAAGGINLSYREGALVLISDHINLQGSNPLLGPNDDSEGPRFPDMTEAYSSAYRTLAHQVAHELKIQLEEGVYAGLTGPTYETPAEIRYLRAIGADLVGMSK
jgi:purine-nucleoside phosphorylase